MELFTIFMLALALNLDSFGVGVTYGVRKITLSFSSVLIICLESITAVSLSMLAGNFLTQIISLELARYCGGIILLLLGAWMIVQGKFKEKKETHSPYSLMQLRIRTLGIVIQVLREPQRADFDKSGAISFPEALLLGLALAFDAFAAGFAFSMLKINLMLTVFIIGGGHIFLIYLGLYCGKFLSASLFSRHFLILPGFILIFLGFLNLT
ncbi:MAG: sporulation membrane protein YtaF [Peptococcaceae bacterium]